MFSCLQILEAFLWFVLITLLNVTLIILTLSVSRLLNLLLRLVAFLLFLNPQCLASISRWITASSSWKRFCLFVCRALKFSHFPPAVHFDLIRKQAVVIPALSRYFFDSSEISESVNFCVMEAIKLCRLDTPIIFIEARINLSRFVVTGCAAKTSATVTFPSLNLISLFAFCFNIWLNGVAS